MNAVSTGFWQWVDPIHPDGRAFLVFVAIVAIVVVVGIVCITVNSIHRRRAEMDLKRELLERGMSSEEIATVLRAKPSGQTSNVLESCEPD